MLAALSVVNTAVFIGITWRLMQNGISSVDNQAALAFIPVLWIEAVIVVFTLNLAVLIFGRKIKRARRISCTEIFRLSECSGGEKAGRLFYLVITLLLMLFGKGLLMPELLWAVVYSLSGGALMFLLFAWFHMAAKEL